MTDREMQDLIAKCRLKSSAPWNVLVSQFSTRLLAVSDRLTEDELYSLMDIALSCYQKGYEEFSAWEETGILIDRARRTSGQSRQQ
jgi:hypothetical protein